MIIIRIHIIIYMKQVSDQYSIYILIERYTEWCAMRILHGEGKYT